MMRCHWNKKRLSAYLDGELSGEARHRVERHLDACAECAQTAAEWQKVYEQLAAPTPHIQPFFNTRLKTRLVPSRSAAKRLPQRLSAAAAICCGLLVGAILGAQLNLALTPATSAPSRFGEYVDAGFLDALPQGSLTDAFINLTETNE